jgi:thymidine phosphorylase
VTATVESIDLITASILSKKLAAGLQGLVMDVKFGSGAFMSNAEDARALAESLVLVANGAGLPTSALLTDMNEPLASAAGNAVEVAYAVDYLTGRRREPRFHEVTVALSAEMLVLGRLAADAAEARAKIEDAIASGRAAETFQRMVAALGGPGDSWRIPAAICRGAGRAPRPPERAGHVARIATRDVGVAVVALGGGRTRPQDPVDHAVGLTDLAPLGDAVGSGRPLGIVHAREEAAAEAAAAACGGPT